MIARLRAVLGLIVVLLVLAGCVSVPTSGPVERVEGEQPTCQDCVNVEVSPPQPGDEPIEIVQGFLRANSNFQPNYAVARQFLTTAGAQKWSPEDGVTVYTGGPMPVGQSVLMDGDQVGALRPDRSFTARRQRLQHDFGLVKENNEWRISNPPPGLYVTQYSFGAFYRSYNIFFTGLNPLLANAVLVPDPIYLPTLRSQANLASALMKVLLTGPTQWLRPAVSTAVPAGTALSVDSVTITDGIATVPLSDGILQLNDQQRVMMAAQVLYTLQQVPTIDAVVFTVNQQPVRIPGGNDTDFSFSADSLPADVQPVPLAAGAQLYVARDRQLLVVDDADPGSSRAVPGPLGERGSMQIDSLAVSAANTDIAVVTDGRTRLRRAGTADGKLTTIDTGASDLLRPQFSRYGELWTIGRSGGKQRLIVVAGDRLQATAGKVLDRGTITAFRISPDGSRLALVREDDEGSSLGLARISRTGRIEVNGWDKIDVGLVTDGALTQVADVAWLDETNLLVLGTGGQGRVPAVYRIRQDGSQARSDPSPGNWDVDRVSTLYGSSAVAAVGPSRQAWREDGKQWQTVLEHVDALAYPG